MLLHIIEQNRSAHLRDRDICLRAMERRLKRISLNPVILKERFHEGGKLVSNYKELEKKCRWALHHAEFAKNGLKNTEGTQNQEIKENISVDYLNTIFSMCQCALKHLNHHAILTDCMEKELNIDDLSVEVIQSAIEETEIIILQITSTVKKRFKLIRRFILNS